MNHDEILRLAKLLGGLFPGQLTQELARYAGENFKAFTVPAVERAIKAHRGTHEFISWPELFEACRASDDTRAASKASDPTRENAKLEGSWADVYRRQCPDLRDAADYEVVLRVHRRWWFRCGMKDTYRSQVESSCVTRLIVFGMSKDDAEKWTEPVFDEYPDYFRQCLEEIRDAAAQPGQGLLV